MALNWSKIRAVQEKSEHFQIFLERTDELAARLRCSLRELAEKINVSQATLFANRTGKLPISRKTWAKLEAAERKAGLMRGPMLEDIYNATVEEVDQVAYAYTQRYPVGHAELVLAALQLAEAYAAEPASHTRRDLVHLLPRALQSAQELRKVSEKVADLFT